jgi:Coenzyme PQQ synthesis protein D (PqqD)
MVLSLSSTIRRNPEVLHSTVGNEVLLMSIAEGKYFGLDTVGSRIWELVEPPKTVAALCARLVEEYDVTPDICQADVLHLLTDLAHQGVVQVTSE